MQEKSNFFTVRPDIEIRFDRKTYTYDDLSQAVSYWSNVINTLPTNNPISIAMFGLSFSAVALLLALFNSKRPYMSVYNNIQPYGALSTTFLVGETFNLPNTDETIPNYSNIIRTDSWSTATNIANWPHRADLTIEFSSRQKHYAYTSGSTGSPKETSVDSYTESLSIVQSINEYFDPNDHCVFSHGMGHVGVHTTATLPALFSAKRISFCDGVTWGEEIPLATHIQYFSTMKDWFKLPPRLRVLTTGGNSLQPEFLNHILTNCQVDKLIDIYGLTECVPPLAIRYIKTLDDISLPFTWINTNHNPYIENSALSIKRADGLVINTGDSCTLHNNQLVIYGRLHRLIRVNGVLHNFLEFKTHFENHTKIIQYVLYTADDKFYLVCYTKDKPTVDQYFSLNQVENIVVTFNDVLNTAGGIKHIK